MPLNSILTFILYIEKKLIDSSDKEPEEAEEPKEAEEAKEADDDAEPSDDGKPADDDDDDGITSIS